MCGRFSQVVSRSELSEILPELPQSSLSLFCEHQRSGIAPTDVALALANGGGAVVAIPVRFGFRISPTLTVINARSETARTKRSFSLAMQEGRIVVPMSGFFEFAREGRRSIPYFFSAPAGPLLAAAILDSEHSGMAILTREAREPVSPIHDRMPVILTPENAMEWLGEGAISGWSPEIVGRRAEGGLSSPSRDGQELLALDPNVPRTP